MFQFCGFNKLYVHHETLPKSRYINVIFHEKRQFWQSVFQVQNYNNKCNSWSFHSVLFEKRSLWEKEGSSIWTFCVWKSDSMTFQRFKPLKLKWYSGLKNYLEIDNYNAALRWYTCTPNVYSLFNDVSNSKCTLEAVLLPSLLLSLLASLQPLLISAYAEINWATGNWQLIGN